MNNRILELMKQADYPAPEMALRAQKLVELVVRECVNICEQGSNTQMTSSGAADRIRLHFGVGNE